MAGSGTTAATGESPAKHRLIAELGHGGMAEVFLAVASGPAGFNKLLVIKQIRPQLAEDPDFLAMFLDEARLAARLNHPNVVQTNEVGRVDNRYFIAMEYLEGQPLNRVVHRLQKAGGMPLGLQLHVVSEALAGLHHAHELTDYDGTPLGVVHRDITPHNIFITYEGQVKVVDFGIAKALNSSSETRTGVLKGKVAYMAPEQARGERVDRRADLFSLGVVLWEAATGTRLWKGIPDLGILQRLFNGDIPAPRSINPDVPEALEAIVLRCLAADRADRYATALDLQADLDAFLDARGGRGSARELSKLVTKQFDADRIKIKAIIEEQLRDKPSSVAPRALPTIDGRVSVTAPGGSPSDRPSAVSSSGSLQITGSGPPAAPSSPSSLFAGAATSDAASSQRRLGILAGAALGLGVLLALGVSAFKRSPAPSTSVTATPAAASVVAPAPKAAAPVEISIAATPPEARLFLDDRPLDHNPFKGSLPAETGQHQLRAEARGYTTQSKTIALDRSVDLELALQREAVADKLSGRVPGPLPTAADDDTLPRPAVKPRRTLDTSNPYAK